MKKHNRGKLERLKQWLDEGAKDLEVIAQRRTVGGATVDRALAVVRQFIVDRDLVLYGGQAIDYALRLRGSHIYPEHQTPDFDFFSPDSVGDAYDLAEMLHDRGFANVVAIRAIHLQTMRVGTDSVFVADISYAPPAVFKSFPTVRYGGMRVLHPDYQRMDMHLAFCFPFNSPPREDVFHRFGKDLKRFNLFERFYPIETGKELGVFSDEDSKKEGGRGPVSAKVDLSLAAVHGFAAYGLLHEALEELLAVAKTLAVNKLTTKDEAGVPAKDERAVEDEKTAKDEKTVEDGKAVEARTPAKGKKIVAPALDVQITEGGDISSITATFPVDAPIVVATPWPEKLLGGTAVKYAPYMDSKPESYAVGKSLEIYSTRNRLLAVCYVRKNVRIVSPQYLLLYFLYEAHNSTGKARDVYVAYYKHTLEILAAADHVLGQFAGTDNYEKLVDSSPFGLTVRVLGDVNHNEAYLVMKARTAQALGETFPDMPDLTAVPKNYYLQSAKSRPTFDYAGNPAFARDGQKVSGD